MNGGGEAFLENPHEGDKLSPSPELPPPRLQRLSTLSNPCSHFFLKPLSFLRNAYFNVERLQDACILRPRPRKDAFSRRPRRKKTFLAKPEEHIFLPPEKRARGIRWRGKSLKGVGKIGGDEGNVGVIPLSSESSPRTLQFFLHEKPARYSLRSSKGISRQKAKNSAMMFAIHAARNGCRMPRCPSVVPRVYTAKYRNVHNSATVTAI